MSEPTGHIPSCRCGRCAKAEVTRLCTENAQLTEANKAKAELMHKQTHRIGWLEDHVRELEKEIAQLRSEIKELREHEDITITELRGAHDRIKNLQEGLEKYGMCLDSCANNCPQENCVKHGPHDCTCGRYDLLKGQG